MVKGEQKLHLLVDVLLDEVTVLRDMIKHKDELLAEKAEIIKKLWDGLTWHESRNGGKPTKTPASKIPKKRGRPKGTRNKA
jgi:hypothetical protein